MADSVLEVSNVSKKYGRHVAVDDLSFEVLQGEVFGLLGPNGAGKTSTIRILMDIFKADSGEVELLGGLPGQSRERVGYLPEERGLYRDQRVLEVLVYLGRLKGVDGEAAKRRALALLERVELEEWGGKRVKELSRGMQQKVQFVACLIHDPELLILDEPFQGLDPVNVEMIKGLMRSQVSEGKTIVLSAHQMNLVEELCDRILLIDEGKALLYGSLKEIKRDFAPNSVRVRAADLPEDLPGVVASERQGDVTLLTLEGIGAQEFLAGLVENNVQVESFERAAVPLNDIFVAMVQGNTHAKKESLSNADSGQAR
ncbi:MAG: ATP-binding cassette domain-containing protein [Caldilineaceae bacterium]|nr:ATP-binding cassette domain-containing protein [Caldilineaceae bacterium]MDE0339825.1 ATP-binding cassette domain-containing protein [Caldilineaceae bacterium]